VRPMRNMTSRPPRSEHALSRAISLRMRFGAGGARLLYSLAFSTSDLQIPAMLPNTGTPSPERCSQRQVF